jgi:hypothetical protein
LRNVVLGMRVETDSWCLGWVWAGYAGAVFSG